jgi:hypothetical protein
MIKYLLPISLILLVVVGLLANSLSKNNRHTRKNAVQKPQIVEVDAFVNEYTFGNDIATVFKKVANDFKGDVAVVHNADVVWVSKESHYILNENETGLEYRDYACNDDLDNFEVESKKILDELVQGTNKVMAKHGFTFNSASATPSVDYPDYYYQAYATEKTKCILRVFFSCVSNGTPFDTSYTPYKFACTDDFEKNYSAQKPFINAFKITNAFISDIKQDGEYFRINVRNSSYKGGYYIIAKRNEDNTWTTFVDRGQQYIECDENRKEIPTSILPCYKGNVLME